MYTRGISGVAVVIIVLLVIVVGAIVMQSNNESAPSETSPKEGDAMMEKEGDAMMEEKSGDAMTDGKSGDAMEKEGDAMMEKEGEAMEEKDAMEKEGDAMEEGAMMEKDTVVITYSDSGFSPKSVEVTQGTTVTWKNEGGKGMWVASDDHPTHEILPEFDQRGVVQTGGEYSFTFTKTGAWDYHNHVGPGDVGTITVK